MLLQGEWLHRGSSFPFAFSTLLSHSALCLQLLLAQRLPLLPFECPHLHTCPHQPKPLPFLLPQYWFSTFQQPLPTCAPCPDLWVPAGSDGGQGLYSVSSPPAGGAWGDPPWPSETKYQGRGNGLTGAHGHLKGYRLPAYPTGWGPRMLSSITNRGGVRGASGEWK